MTHPGNRGLPADVVTFLEVPVDPYYAEARKSSAIIGFSCIPDDTSLCKATGTDIIEEGFDLFFVKLKEELLVWIGSSLGYDMAYAKEEYFDEVSTLHGDHRVYLKLMDIFELGRIFSVFLGLLRFPFHLDFSR